VPVTDEQVATLRAYLAGDFEEHERLRGQLEPDADRDGWGALIAAGCLVAADRRFANAPDDIVGYVGSVRARSDELADEINPHVAERLLRYSATGEGSIADIDAQTQLATQFVFLASLVHDSHYDDQELDRFLSQSREIADHWIQ
jgi:hypothetical protein